MTTDEMLALVPALFGALVGVWLVWIPRRQPNRLASVNPTVYVPPPKPPAAVPASIREELDDTPTYWDTRFHQLLENLGAASVVGETWEFRTWSDAAVYEYAERGYPDCPCSNCRRICA